MAEIIQKNLGKFSVILVIFSLVTGWFFSGWPQIFKNPPIPPEIQEAQAALPTFVACGAAIGGTGAIIPALPAGIATNDILLLFLETENEAITIPTPNGGTWTEVLNSPQGTGVAAGTNATRLTVFWSRYNGTQGDPTTSDSGDHQVGAICAYRGIITTGDPWDVTSGSVDATSDTSGDIPGATTTGPDRLVVIVGAGDDDADTPITTVTNADLANISAARVNAETGLGSDGGLTVFDGQKASEGAYGITTLTYTAATTKGMMTIALKPPAVTISITRTDAQGTIAYGSVLLSGSTSTDPAGQNKTTTFQNDGTATEKFSIKTSAATGGTGWTAVATTPGSNEFRHSFATTTPVINWQVMGIDPSYAIASSSVAVSGTLNIYLKIETPSASDYVQKTITVTVLAESAP